MDLEKKRIESGLEEEQKRLITVAYESKLKAKTLKASLDTVWAESVGLEQKLSKQNHQIHQLEEEILSLQTKLRQKIDSTAQKSSVIYSIFHQQKQKIERLQAKLAQELQNQEDISQSKKEKIRLLKEKCQIEAGEREHLAPIRAAEEELEALREQNQTLDSTINRLRAEKNRLNDLMVDRMTSMETKMDAKADFPEIVAARIELKSLKDECLTGSRRIQELRNEIAAKELQNSQQLSKLKSEAKFIEAKKNRLMGKIGKCSKDPEIAAKIENGLAQEIKEMKASVFNSHFSAKENKEIEEIETEIEKMREKTRICELETLKKMESYRKYAAKVENVKPKISLLNYENIRFNS